ncbi:hypothetical protein IV454_14520 [Massilia antarctica]|uniref:Uncharacterized protein n=1 Tax=Massilia antarctica TaxID=2765360 RepID=A0AA49AAU4_9BURK|nr:MULTISPECIES: hypothetical protein [Massilia]MCY0913079.1 hypothetical protein [Massilia sp. H27-R4]QPI52591.1 hypothetical protein IV454_14520 [Massilia antarctica]CUI07667.1 hypothetical protein BN2497_10111 [Janthinobacterium sp. CG23_2]CUU31453.1 hypothetical protein BN3177_10111 [Janthinobacterium sp. CG23_2]
MTEHPIDFTAVRAELRALNRSSLLIIAERAVELIPEAQLSTLLNDVVRLTARPSKSGNAPVSLLEEVRAFYDAAMAGNYYETVEINNRSRQEQSEGTDAFIAECHRLLHQCIRAADREAPSEAGVSFELLFGLLSHIDEGNDDVLFFANDGSSSDVGVDWRAALPAYFRCLARTSSPEEFARTVEQAIADFVICDRSWYLDVARTVANDAQRITLDTLVT